MKLTIESTDTVTDLEGVPVRLWHGVTTDGIPCKVFVHRIGVALEQDQRAFDGLAEQLRPSTRGAEAVDRLMSAHASALDLIRLLNPPPRLGTEQHRLIVAIGTLTQEMLERGDLEVLADLRAGASP